ncbi:MAG: sulfite exporter TauE/SafE family protein, partial [Gemmiger sp.]
MTQKQFYVEGMTCSGCERTLESAVSRLQGVCAVQADRKNGRLQVRYREPCTEEQIARAVETAGYSVTEAPPRRSDGVCLLLILLGLYVIAHQLGWTRFLSLFPTVSGAQIGYAALFLIGLLTSMHCIAMCGGLNLAQSMNSGHPVRGSVLYNLGRLTSYTLIGGILGFVGEKAAITLKFRGIVGLAAGMLMLVMGVCLMGNLSLPPLLRLPKPVRRALAALRRKGSFAIGLANGLMPCGPLQSMQLYAIASGSFLGGAASMFFFCLGTIPLVLGMGTAAGVLKMSWRKRMVQLGSALLVLMGLFTVQNNLALAGFAFPGAVGTGDGPVIAVLDGGAQYVTTTLRANGYEDIQVVAGIPVVWTIMADGKALNGCNNEIVLPAFDQQVKLAEGANIIHFTPEEPGEYLYSC